MNTRYDIIVTFNVNITEFYYAGDALVSGLSYENLHGLTEMPSLGENDFFPQLLKDLEALFGGDDRTGMNHCAVNDKELSIYYSCKEKEVENFSKNILGWVLLNELESTFVYCCVIDYQLKEFTITDVNGNVRKDTLKIVAPMVDEALN